MPGQSSSGLALPKYQRSKRQLDWVASERRTANLIQSLWNAAGRTQRNDPAFLCLLVQCGWNTGGRKNGGNSTRRWRNHKMAEYLTVPYGSDQQLAQDLRSHFRSLSLSRCLSIVQEKTGITRYYTAYHPATRKFVKRHSKDIALAFRQVSSRSADVYNKIRTVATLIEPLGEISAGGHHISAFNGLTPVLSCLDPQRRFPIMNKLTRALLKRIDKKADEEGAVALSKLIGPEHGRGHGIPVQPEPPKRGGLACSMCGCHCRQPCFIQRSVPDSTPDRACQCILSLSGDGPDSLRMTIEPGELGFSTDFGPSLWPPRFHELGVEYTPAAKHGPHRSRPDRNNSIISVRRALLTT